MPSWKIFYYMQTRNGHTKSKKWTRFSMQTSKETSALQYIMYSNVKLCHPLSIPCGRYVSISFLLMNSCIICAITFAMFWYFHKTIFDNFLVPTTFIILQCLCEWLETFCVCINHKPYFQVQYYSCTDFTMQSLQ